MRRGLGFCLVLATCFVVANCAAPAVGRAGEAIATIDTYGLKNVRREVVLAASGLHVGDPPPDKGRIAKMVRRLEAIGGVERADVSVVFVRRQNAPSDKGPQPTVYIGIREVGQPVVSFRPAPSSHVVLPNEVVVAYREHERAILRAFRRRRDEQPTPIESEAPKASERKLVELVERHCARVVEVLRAGESSEQRNMAAQALGHAANKAAAAVELNAASRDPDPSVRNSAMRALGVFLSDANGRAKLTRAATVESYVELLESLVWTDRNKAMFVLIGLTSDGNPKVLAMLRGRSLPALAEMAGWGTEGHAVMALMLLGRTIGMNDAETLAEWRSGRRNDVIAKAREIASDRRSESERPSR